MEKVKMIKTSKKYFKFLFISIFSFEGLIRGLLSYLVFLILIVSLQYLFFLFMPHDYWLTYESIEPKAPMFRIEDDVIFVSKTIYGKGRGIDIEWNDIMRCSVDGGEYIYYSNSDTSLSNWNPPKGQESNTSEWKYGGLVPGVEAICYLDSRITYILGFGVEKHQSVTSNIFVIR